MSTLVVGLSFRTAPLALLERASLGAAQAGQLELALRRSDHVAESVVLSTCNRLEVYAEVSRFHGGVVEVGEQLAAVTGVPLTELTDHLYVHYEVAAVAHLFTVACGLDSMAVGEQQILGQVRSALREGQDAGSVGRGLGPLLQQALRVGKRAHAETGLDRAGSSLVEAGLAQAQAVLGPLQAVRALILGAGAMSGLAAATLARAGVGELAVANRTLDRAQRLATSAGGRVVPLDQRAAALADADLVVSCTGASGHLVSVADARAALDQRAGRPQVYLDLALPRDVDPRVAELAGATVVDLEWLGRVLAGEAVGADLADVRALIAAEVSGYQAGRQAESVAPTVVALRAHARSVTDAELERLRARLGPQVDERVLAELEQAVHRVVEKLLHTPTVRVKELASQPGASSYAEALRELFGLDLGRIAAVSAIGDPAGLAGPA